MKQNEVKIYTFSWKDEAEDTIESMIGYNWQVLSIQQAINGDWIVVFWK